MRITKLVVLIIIGAALILPMYLSNIDIDEKLTSRITSLKGLINDETARFETIKEGLRKLTFVEFITGAGLSSVINSGPHNDFVRWIQRVGIVGAFLGFMPFLVSFVRSFKLMRKSYTIYHAFIFLSIIFTLYISLFGYPRDDAYQAPYVWLGLSLWLIVDRLKFHKI